MKKFILLLLFIPFLSFGQERNLTISFDSNKSITKFPFPIFYYDTPDLISYETVLEWEMTLK